MMKKTLFILVTFLPAIASGFALKSPDGALEVTVSVDDVVRWSLSRNGETLIEPSEISLNKWGVNSKLISSNQTTTNQTWDAPFYHRARVRDHYNGLFLRFREGFALEFRAYNSGVAYRFVSLKNRPLEVSGEHAEFNFKGDHKAWVPFVRVPSTELEPQLHNSFENVYTYNNIGAWPAGKLAFSPLTVEFDGGVKVCIAEADVEGYPGMFLQARGNNLEGLWAPYPKSERQGGHNNLQMTVTEREDYIARRDGKGSFPWRIAVVSTDDAQMADNDLVWLLAAPSRVEDTSWIEPGKVAWEWWNDWGVMGVDFRAGVNNDTYKHYIDFASDYGIEYVILDEGWAVNGEADLMRVVPEIDLKELIDYAGKKDVGIILWAGYWAFARDMEAVCAHYAKMGVRGFKIDFMDRDDQKIVDFHYLAAATAAKYELLIDFHGTYKPTGINRTWPNVVNFEGVHGLEQLKWNSLGDADQVVYDVTMPFIRQLAGPVDYTQGAMRNAGRRNYRAVYSEPMSVGTRCRQLGEYVVFFSPLNMLCDSPAAYRKEDECTRFIVGVPTVWDETRVVAGEIGKYIVTARRKGETWYVGGLTDWNVRTVELDLSFMGEGRYELFTDGANADHRGEDYRVTTGELPRTMTLTMAPAGGFAMKIWQNQ